MRSKENILHVKGMHCSSCEILIEKKILKKPHVTAVDVSLGDDTAKVYVERGHFVDLDDLNREFEALGYRFAKSPFPKEVQTKGQKLVGFAKTLAVALGFLAVFFFLEKMQLGRYVSVDATSSLAAFFLLGIVAGISSCAALIGGILLSLIKHWNELYLADGGDTMQRKMPHTLFHAGRLASFFVLGGVLGLLGEKASLGGTTFYAVLVTAVSIVMFILALQMLDVGWAQHFRFRLPKFITRAAADEKKLSGKYMPFATGAFTFFLPCGFTLIAQGVALTTGSFTEGALVMTAFALGTMPMLLGISMTGLKFTEKPHLTAKFLKVAGVVVLFFALYNVNGQMNVLGLPSLSDIRLSSASYEIPPCDPEIASCFNAAGEQEVKVIARGFEYVANGTQQFQAGVPTKLIVDNQGALGCASFIASRGLFPDFVALQKGRNVIDLGTPRKGTYKLTCSMGMVEPLRISFK